MKFNIHITFKGPGGTVEAPNKYNPVEAEDIWECAKQLGETKPEFSGFLTVVGLRIEPANPEGM